MLKRFFGRARSRSFALAGQPINGVSDAFPVLECTVTDERSQGIADFAVTESFDELLKLAFNFASQRR